ncbi:hypothetical protein PAAG_01751 [Paracoccidioides lutzii Pb01]|uniref:cytidine deaminase n=1 Tax=Paracoccidioides lutzii (strain ATCC MYA-826 / Pb01) TaxID=502779 RepID=C1GTA6_PARBA|nr:hypothetical protein PAAG_01751 [Paracoccidioides lutzii Pb01]EEH39289.2 hypothetical protein PAAG_01751 [Paracoccidioides lutzii Pb01]
MPSAVSTTELQTLSSKAIAAKETAYCPYSKFRVGACLLTEEGEFVVGANVENVSYPVGVCAERCAFGTAVVAGHKSFKAIAVATDISPGASPCGMCRQFMREFCTQSFPVYMYGKDGKYIMKTMGEPDTGAAQGKARELKLQDNVSVASFRQGKPDSYITAYYQGIHICLIDEETRNFEILKEIVPTDQKDNIHFNDGVGGC